PTEPAIEIFGQDEVSLEKNVKETLNWLKTEGKNYFDYWKNKEIK
ncbi:MAG: NAD(P)-dependent oxidoreductase, partial [Methylotenera sp.]|nr:NAD(P)-dependent oxidoreductase [Flavobacterium sp.]